MKRRLLSDEEIAHRELEVGIKPLEPVAEPAKAEAAEPSKSGDITPAPIRLGITALVLILLGGAWYLSGLSWYAHWINGNQDPLPHLMLFLITAMLFTPLCAFLIAAAAACLILLAVFLRCSIKWLFTGRFG